MYRTAWKHLLWRRASPICLAVLGCFTCIVWLFPQFGLARFLSLYPPFAQLLAFPQAIGLALLFLGVFLLALSWRRKGAGLALVSCLVWFLAGAGFLFVPQGIPRQVNDPLQAVKTQRSLTIVTFNTGARMSTSDFHQLVTAWDPDIIVLPETSGYELRQAIETLTYDGWLFETPDEGLPGTYTGQVAPTSVIVHKRLGAARFIQGPVTSFGTVAIEFDDASLPLLVGLHAAPPLPGLMDEWRKDINRVLEFSNSTQKPLLVAGDFNANLRHGPLTARGKLIDSQEFCSPVHAGTWPAGAPNLLRSAIDHVFVVQGMVASSCQVKQIGPSDHLAYKTQVAL